MRETLISAGRPAPHDAEHDAEYDTRDVVARYRHRQAQRRALLGPPVPRPARPASPLVPAPSAAPAVPGQPEGWSC